MKQLSEMTLDELWQLFPIILTEHNSCWKQWFTKEANLIKQYLPMPCIVRISHIGSTAVEGIWAKPIIDILVEVSEGIYLASLVPLFEKNGYICMKADRERISFNKGYTLQGFAERVFHLHLRYVGDNDELYFRDYLNANPTVAKEYEQLKLGLWKQYEHDRDSYTHAKTQFITIFTQQAKDLLPDKYAVKPGETLLD